MVCFKGGRPDRKNYRRFRIKSVEGINDFAMMKEVIRRRYKRIVEESKEVPDLLIVDGGKGQLSSAIEALSGINIKPFPVIGLAKRNEEIFLPGRSEGILLDKSNSALNILRAIRDEAHRFAISFNREIRLKKISQSILDDIEDIGAKRKNSLLRAFHSIRELRNSTPEEIHKRTGIVGLKLAEKVINFLKRSSD
jgi:excinuclease ABC subunit C